MIITFVIRIIVQAILLLVFSKIFTTIGFDSWQHLLIASVVLGLVNGIIRPIIKLLAWPLTFMTLGLFVFVINLLMLYITDWLTPGMHLDSIVTAFILSVVVWLINVLISCMRD